MSRFLITHRRAGKRRAHEHRRAREVLDRALNGPELAHADRLSANVPRADHARHVVLLDADAEEMARRQWHPELIVEPPALHYAGRLRPPETGRAEPAELAAEAGRGREHVIRVDVDEDAPPGAVDVFFRLADQSGTRQVVRRTDDDGLVRLHCDPGTRIVGVAVVPHARYWPLFADTLDAQADFRLHPLPPAERHLGWWHRAMGLERWNPEAGEGIRVGIIDTGLGSHAALAHVTDLGSLIDGEHTPPTREDPRGHGTHVAGLIAARPHNPQDFGGMAAGADVYSLRVFGDGGGAHQGDIALALEALAVERGCHLVNLSLGCEQRSEIERDALVDAATHGCLIISAAGNTGGALEYPAAFEEAVAVTAVGREGCAPEGTLAAHRRPAAGDRFGSDGFYLANFCCTGDGVEVTAPGVGIISTVPDDGWAAYGGTSMAAPLVAGRLAARLADHSDYRHQAGNEQRSQMARQQLRSICCDLGLAHDLQGHGLPMG